MTIWKPWLPFVQQVVRFLRLCDKNKSWKLLTCPIVSPHTSYLCCILYTLLWMTRFNTSVSKKCGLYYFFTWDGRIQIFIMSALTSLYKSEIYQRVLFKFFCRRMIFMKFVEYSENVKLLDIFYRNLTNG